MNWLPWKRRMNNRWTVYTDGAIRPQAGKSGLGAVVFNDLGEVVFWWSRQAGALTNNEAEYGAAILALEELRRRGSGEVDLYSDSQVLVQQMQGLATARAANLRQAQAHLRRLAAGFRRVSFHHIRREHNRLADALANEAADGRALDPLDSDPERR